MSKNNLKLLTSTLLICGIAGCSNGVTKGNNQTVTPTLQDQKTPRVSISRTSTIPTSYGISASHALKVDNLTDEPVSLVGFNISGTQARGIATRTMNAISKALGGVGYDNHVNLSACNNIPANGSCVLQVTPDAKDGSTAIQLTYKGKDGHIFKAAQLVEYSSHLSNQGGFTVTNANIDRIASTSRYSISIPFVAEDDYAKVEVDSSIINYGTSVDCANGATKGSSCTALITLPAGNPGTEYANKIELVGVKADGTIKATSLVSGHTYNDFANLAITNGPLVINGTDGTIHVVNNGTKTATNIIEGIEHNQGWLKGPLQQLDNLQKTVICDGSQGSDLPQEIGEGEACQVKFALKDKAGTGSSDYTVSYSSGANGVASSSTTTKIYYIGDDTPDHSFRVEGSLGFQNTRVGTALEKTVTVVNQGKEAINDLTVEQLPSDFEIVSSGTTCGENINILSGQSCTFTFKYQPLQEQSSTSNMLHFVSKTAGSSDEKFSVTRLLAYSAVSMGGKGVVFIPERLDLSIFANNKDKYKTTVQIQNVGDIDYELSSISQPSAKALTIEIPATLSKGSDSNPFAPSNSEKVLKGGGVAEIVYNFGPVDSEVADNTEVTVFEGKYKGDAVDSNLRYSVGYNAVPSTVEIEEDDHGLTVGDSTIDRRNDPADSTRPYEFTLTKKNIATVSFSYKFSADTEGFRVDDTDLPFGWLVNKEQTTCPVASLGKPATKIHAGVICTASYSYLAKELAHPLFYQAAATGHPVTITAPKFSVNGGSQGISVSVPTQNAASYTIIAKPFAKVTATKIYDASQSNNDFEVYYVRFTPDDDYRKSGYQTFGNIVFKPIYTDYIIPAGASQTCIYTGGSQEDSCSITIAVRKSKNPNIEQMNLNFTYSLEEDSSYNAMYGKVDLNRD